MPKNQVQAHTPVSLQVEVQILPGNEDLALPAYMTEGAAGMDLRAAVQAELEIPPGEWRAVPAGLALAIPTGFEGQVRPRSGLAARYGITCLNSPGTVDSDYRGEIKVILINHGKEPFVVRRGDRTAQLVIAPVARAALNPVTALPDTSRGEGGFGHTGRT